MDTKPSWTHNFFCPSSTANHHHSITDDEHCNDYYDMLTWPPTSYTCSFCKREFRSAQALGGHMNVHRRDRAHLRSLSSSLNLSLNPNPNPSYCSSPASLGYNLKVKTARKTCLCSCILSAKLHREKSCDDELKEKDVEINLNAGAMEDLDLELRLGIRYG